MRRSTVYRYLAQLAEQGRAVQVGWGRWRAANPGEVTMSNCLRQLSMSMPRACLHVRARRRTGETISVDNLSTAAAVAAGLAMSSRIVGRGFERNLDAGPLQPMIGSFELHLRAEKKSPKTIRTYIEAAQWLAAEYLIPNEIKFWADVTTRHVQEWTVTLLGRYSDSYANNQFRALQQFFKWHATEDPDEPRLNPMANLKPPKVSDKLVPVFTENELAAMLATCKGGGFQNRRDYAIISLFKDAGIRLSELAGLGLDDVSPASREATVTGKGDKQRTVRFTYDTARALDRYSRERAKHPMARVSALWLGVRGGPMTASGIYQMIERRGRDAGVEVNPHKFRHTFSHNWLDNGGAEGDLMELNGWSSPQMLARYGRSARSARARRHYDDVMGD